eukprot:TRINITY_DN578_c0_g1_i2.p1 TRINITY_DN578_c0_g1~~TRINITY_DN578_c0_g1_i2.p1  ORF type:complete len:766 (+),score=182.72 TRINITY_DN578_c0_g1_i2:489-2786(+)
MPKLSRKKAIAHARLDKFYYLARDQGLRARSAFKLSQLNRKYGFLQKARTLVDLGAAPGGWLQIANKVMPLNSHKVGVDLDPIKFIPGCKTIVGDFTTEKVRKEIIKALQGKQADVVLCDAAPNVSGAWSKDAYVQNVLVLSAIRAACGMLAPKGTFVTKIFRSPDYTKLIFVLNQLFEKVEATKPLASRVQSAEIFVVCREYKAPKTIDPNLFNPKEIFAELDEPEKQLRHKQSEKEKLGLKEKRHNDYEFQGGVFSESLYKAISLTDFVGSKDPEDILGKYHEITIDPIFEQRFIDSPKTNQELLECCKDLQSCNHFSKKKMLKWREQLFLEEKARLAEEGDEEEEEELEEAEEEEEPEDNETQLKKMEEQLKEYDEQTKKEAKKRMKQMITRKLKLASRSGFNPNDNPLLEHYESTVYSSKLEEQLQNTGIDNSKLEDEYDEAFNNGEITPTAVTRYDVFTPHQYGEEGYAPPEDRIDEDDEDDDDEEDDEEVGEAEPSKPLGYYARLEKLVTSAIEEGKRAKKPGKQDKIQEFLRESYMKGAEQESDADKEEPLVHEESDPEEVDSDAELHRSLKRVGNAPSAREDRKKAPRKIGFEEVPTELWDPETRSKILAMASHMLDRKGKRELLENAVHRFTFADDPQDLPKWFIQEEQRAYSRPLPVTQEDVHREIERFRAINARPPKKVMEAIHRKRIRAKRVVKKILNQAEDNPRSLKRKTAPTLRKIMRSQWLRNSGKKKAPVDNRTKGEKKRTQQKLKKRR